MGNKFHWDKGFCCFCCCFDFVSCRLFFAQFLVILSQLQGAGEACLGYNADHYVLHFGTCLWVHECERNWEFWVCHLVVSCKKKVYSYVRMNTYEWCVGCWTGFLFSSSWPNELTNQTASMFGCPNRLHENTWFVLVIYAFAGETKAKTQGRNQREHWRHSKIGRSRHAHCWETRRRSWRFVFPQEIRVSHAPACSSIGTFETFTLCDANLQVLCRHLSLRSICDRPLPLPTTHTAPWQKFCWGSGAWHWAARPENFGVIQTSLHHWDDSCCIPVVCGSGPGGSRQHNRRRVWHCGTEQPRLGRTTAVE